MDKLKKRLDDLELIQNNIKLLNELLSHYRPESSEHEKQLIQVCLLACGDNLSHLITMPNGLFP